MTCTFLQHAHANVHIRTLKSFRIGSKFQDWCIFPCTLDIRKRKIIFFGPYMYIVHVNNVQYSVDMYMCNCTCTCNWTCKCTHNKIKTFQDWPQCICTYTLEMKKRKIIFFGPQMKFFINSYWATYRRRDGPSVIWDMAIWTYDIWTYDIWPNITEICYQR